MNIIFLKVNNKNNNNNYRVCNLRLQEIIPSEGGSVIKNGESVSASWGGFHASASLADDGSAVASAGGNGLGAGAGYGAGGAGAGAGAFGAGSASSAGASSAEVLSKPSAGVGYGHGGKPGNAGGSSLYNQGGPGNGFFDKIFAVSTYNTYIISKATYKIIILYNSKTK